ncbi:MAG: hypothetical protein U0269_37645 [Polyangiales bacterium]
MDARADRSRRCFSLGSKGVRALLVLLAASSTGCPPRRATASRVARGLDVSTGVASLDADLARVRSMQITVNESEREYLEILSTLALRLSATQDPELTSLASAVRRAADELHANGKALALELDVSAAETVMRNGDSRTGCDQFAQPANAHRCQTDLSQLVRVVFHERPVRATDDDEDPADVDPLVLPVTNERFATATATAIAELAALRIRLGAVAERADPLRASLERASAPARYERELRDAIEFLVGVAARARVVRRQVTTAAEGLANSAQRAAR